MDLQFKFVAALFIFVTYPVDSFSKVHKDQLYFRLNNDYFTLFEVNQSMDRLKSFYCFTKDSILFNKLQAFQKAKYNSNFVLSDFLKSDFSSSFFSVKDHQLLLNFIRLEKFAISTAIKVSYKSRKELVLAAKKSKCLLGDDSEVYKKTLRLRRVEELLMTRFSIKLQREKERDFLLNFFESLESQYLFEKFSSK